MPDDVDPRDLDPEVRAELRGLVKDTADLVARHLVVAGRLLDEDPERALPHARAAGALAGRVGSVREAVGLAAYAAGEWAEALSELRTARRITGRADHLAVIGDCERALGRPERAVALLDDPDVPGLEQTARVELVIVAAGARRDMGQPDAGVLLLQGPARATTARRPWAARLWYAYADALLAAGREDEAREWFARAAERDEQGETDAEERLLELDGLVFEDLQDDGADEGDEPEADEQVDLQALLAEPVPARAEPPLVPAADEDPVAPGADQESIAPEQEQAQDRPREDEPAAGTDSTSAEADAQVAVDAPAPQASAGARGPAAAGPLFSDGEQAPVAESRRGGVPTVSFAAPPQAAPDEDDDQGQDDSSG